LAQQGAFIEGAKHVLLPSQHAPKQETSSTPLIFFDAGWSSAVAARRTDRSRAPLPWLTRRLLVAVVVVLLLALLAVLLLAALLL
jgi:hypothetical protein